MQILRKWRARRAGGRMTIYYRNDSGADAKVCNVDEIAIDDDYNIVATDMTGAKYSLATANAA